MDSVEVGLSSVGMDAGGDSGSRVLGWAHLVALQMLRAARSIHFKAKVPRLSHALAVRQVQGDSEPIPAHGSIA